MIYVDSCVAMYIVGKEHPLKKRAIEILPRLIHAGETLCTSVEAFQEIIHRYKSIDDPEHQRACYAALEDTCTVVHDVTKPDVDLAQTFSIEYKKLSVRDCLHAAVMKRLKCSRVLTFDAGFDVVPWIERIY